MKKFILLFCGLLLGLAACNSNVDSLSQLPSKYVQMDSVKVHYKSYGSGSQALVFVHGIGCDMNAWVSQFPAFKDSVMMVFVDLPGHGLSDKPHTEYTLDFLAKAVKTVLDDAGVDDAVLVGHSLGTAVCREVVFDYPSLVSGFCDVDGVYCLYPYSDSTALAEYTAQVNAFAESFASDSLENMMRGFVGTLFCESTTSSVREYATSCMPYIPQYVAYSIMSNLIQTKYWTGEVISIPSLIICTQNSGIMPDNREQMSALYSSMKYEELTSVGHFIMMERPEWFNASLKVLL